MALKKSEVFYEDSIRKRSAAVVRRMIDAQSRFESLPDSNQCSGKQIQKVSANKNRQYPAVPDGVQQ
jgi:hypothetical protein